MNQLTITISGPHGSGRTTLAAELSQFLEERGLRVINRDDDVPQEWHRDGRCLEALASKGTQVDIATRAVARQPKPGSSPG
jgi:tRNA uridine 5-carbamoylmethylation protein Kti12